MQQLRAHVVVLMRGVVAKPESSGLYLAKLN